LRIVTDQINNQVRIPSGPLRIVCAVPSLTELLFDLGLQDSMVGITKYCVHPAEDVVDVPKIGGTKDLQIDKIIALQPTLIIANKEENIKEQIETLTTHCAVLVTDISTIDDGLQAIALIGEAVNKIDTANYLILKIKQEILQLGSFTKLRAAYLIWRKPYMGAGADTYITQMMHLAGFTNCIQQHRYPAIVVDDLQQLQLDILLLSSEPFPFAQKHIDELQPYLPNTSIIIVDGEMFSWYGSRLLHAPKYFSNLRANIL
jgi:ABC-type Fe3+-hydroxamate transport system substrate-binding protein